MIVLEFEDTFGMLCNEDKEIAIEKIPLALQALGLDIIKSGYDELIAGRNFIEFDIFVSILEIAESEYHASTHMQDEIQEMFDTFDKDRSGGLDASELKRVFVKIGEKMTDKELEDQLKDFDVDHDMQNGVGEFDMMVKSTRAVDFIFDS